MIPKDMKLAIQILDKLEYDEIGMINDMMKWKAQEIFEDLKNQLGKFIMKFRDQCAGETDI